MTSALVDTITAAFEQRAEFNPKNAPADVRTAVDEALALLDTGKARVAEKIDSEWRVNEWLKKAVLLSFRLNDNQPIDAGYTRFFDKVPLKHADYDEARFRADGVRVVPHAIVRRGAFVASECGADAFLREHRRVRRRRNDGRYVGDGRFMRADRHAMCTCRAASASVACSSRCRQARRSSKTTASSARVLKSSKVSSSKKARCSRWAFSSARARAFTIARTTTILRGRVPAGSVVVPGSLPSAERQVQPVLRHHRQTCERADAREDEHQRAATRVTWRGQLMRPDG